jgi:phage tail sheath protein FI
MKYFTIFCLINLLTVSTIFSQSNSESKPIDRQENKPIGVVVFVKGDVKIGNKKLKMGEKLINGETIKTGEKSSCDIQVTSTSSPVVVRIKEKSTFQLNETIQGDEKQLKSVIDSGKAVFNVSRLNSKEKMEVVTPTQTCGVRGTKFEMGVKSTGKERTLVTEGKVSTKIRIGKLEGLNSDNGAISEIASTIDKNASELEAGAFANYSKNDSEEFLKQTGLQEIVDNASEEDFQEKFENLVKDPNFKGKLNTSLKKIASPDVQKLDNKALQKKNNMYEELIPIDPHLLNRKGLLNDFLKQRNKEKNMISIIRKLEEENEQLKLELEEIKKD